MWPGRAGAWCPDHIGEAPSKLRSGLPCNKVDIAPQIERPALIAGDGIADAFPTLAMALQVAMLDLDAGPPSRFGGEPHLPLAGFGRVGLDAPLRADVPAQEHAVGRLIGQHARPAALAAVDTAVIDMAADPGLEHCLGDLGCKQIVLWRFETAEILGENLEGALDRRLDHDGLFHGGDGDLGVHGHSSGRVSTASL